MHLAFTLVLALVSLAVAPQQGGVLAVEAVCDGGAGNKFAYVLLARQAHEVRKGDLLVYELLLDRVCPSARGGVDLVFKDGSNLRDSGAVDQEGRRSHGDTPLPAAKKDWVRRKIDLSAHAGKTIDKWLAAFEGDQEGIYVQYLRGLGIERDGATATSVVLSGGKLDWQSGYYEDSVKAQVREAASWRGEFDRARFAPVDLAGLRDVDAVAGPGDPPAKLDRDGNAFPPDEWVPGPWPWKKTVFVLTDGKGMDAVACRGQQIDLAPAAPAEEANVLHLLLTAVQGSKDVDFKVVDGSGGERKLPLRALDWCAQNKTGAFRTFAHRVRGEQRDRSSCALYHHRFVLAGGARPAKLVLPDSPEVILFAVTVERVPDVAKNREVLEEVVRGTGGPEAAAYLATFRVGSVVRALDFGAHDRFLAEVFAQLRAGGKPAAGDWERRYAALAAEGLDPKLRDLTIHYVGQSHIDVAWLWRWRETVDVCRDTFNQVDAFMNEFPDFTYSQSQAVLYQFMERFHPQVFEKIKKRVAEGRWEVVGGMWGESDANLPDGEALVRQFLHGKLYFREKLGVDVKIGWLPDSFGFNWNLPQIMKKSGVDSFMTTKLNWSDTTKFPHRLFWWEAPDGSRVLALQTPGGCNDQVHPKQQLGYVQKMVAENAVPHAFVPYGVGDHGGGPTRADIEAVHAQDQARFFPKSVLSKAGDYFDAVRKTEGANIPVWKDECYLEFHRGTYTTQALIKKRNREGQEKLRLAEWLSVWAARKGAAYPAERLDKGWKTLLFNQFHDILPGSAYGESVADAHEDYVALLADADQLIAEAAAKIAPRYPETEDFAATHLVLNPLARARHEAVLIEGVKAARGNLEQSTPRGALVEVSVPAFGYLTVNTGSFLHGGGRVATEVKVTKTDNGVVLENREVRVRVAADGTIPELFLKMIQRNLAREPLNKLVLYRDEPKQWDAWDINYVEAIGSPKFESIEVVEQGPLRATVRLVGKVGSSKIVQDVSLCRLSPRVDISLELDWREERHALRALFPLEVKGDSATYEIPYATIERTARPKTKAEEAKHEVPALRFADMAGDGCGVALLNDTKHGHSAKENVLGLTLLRSPHQPKDNKLADQGEQTMRYALFPHVGDWRGANVTEEAIAFNEPLVAFKVDVGKGKPTTGSLVESFGEGFLVTVLKKAERADDLILRLYETHGRKGGGRVKVNLELKEFAESDLMEKPLAEFRKIDKDGIAFDLAPHEIKTFRLR